MPDIFKLTNLSKEKKITLIICFSIYALIILLIIINEGGRDTGTEIGMAGLSLGLVYLLISLLLLISEQTRKVGKAILLSSGIIFLIGLGVCSAYPIRFVFISPAYILHHI